MAGCTCPILVVGKSDCSDCREAMCMLVHKNKCFCYCSAESQPQIMEEVEKEHHHKTVPAIFVDGKFIGGHKELAKHFEN
ncbi:hypothetical protein COBT_001288 [Conglomerata obtusa]